MLIPINQIAVINRQRKNMDLAEVEALAQDIEAIGLLHPIVVRRPHPHETSLVEGRPYVLMVGGRRLAAHVLLKREEIEVKLKDDLSPIEARIAELSENIKRVNISWQEETDARAEIDALLKELNPNSTLEERAEAVGVSKAQLSKDLTLHKQLKQDPTLKHATSKGAAIRNATFKETIATRLKTAEKSAVSGGLSDLRSKLFTADGRSFIRNIPSQSIDLVFCDLPYGIDYFDNTKAGRKSEQIHSYYDDSFSAVKDTIADLVPQFVRVVKPSGWIVLFMSYEWHGWLQDLLRTACVTHGEYREKGEKGCSGSGGVVDRSNECRFLNPELPPWIWTRRGKGNHGHWPELHASNRYEMVVVCNGGEAKLTKKPVENVLDFPPMEGERLHAMQKPHELCKEIISRTTVLGERVLDVCMGSGAHMAAAADLKRDFLGCELNPDLLGPALTLVGQYYNKTLHDSIQRGKGGAARPDDDSSPTEGSA